MTHIRNYKMKRTVLKMTIEQMIENELQKNEYYHHSVEHNPEHAELIRTIVTKRITRQQNESSDIEPQIVENDGQRNLIGNYNDNETLIKKCFVHLNAMKRSQTLSNLSDNEFDRLYHENVQFKQRDALELTLRKLQLNIKQQK